MLCSFLCTAVESKIGKKIEDRKSFCEYLGNIYMSDWTLPLSTSSETFVNDARDMISHKEESDSPMPLLCELIYEAQELYNKDIEFDQKKLFETLEVLYKAYRMKMPSSREKYANYARSIIHNAIAKKILDDDTSD